MNVFKNIITHLLLLVLISCNVTYEGPPSTVEQTPPPVTVPTISFSRDSYSYSESGSNIGNKITLVRNTTGSTHDVTLTVSAITATGSDLTLGSQTVSFGVNDQTVALSGSLFGLINNSATNGDKQFRVNISAPTNGAILSGATEAVVNLLDDQLPDQFLFSKSLYTVAENAGSASILIQRAGPTTSAGSVQVNFIADTALAGSNFTATVLTANFAAGQSEASVNVPIAANSVVGSRSFFVKLQNPSSGTSLRASSIAKVRIMDDDETRVCDTSTTPFGGGVGSAIDPYRICSVSQLNEVRNNLDKSYKLMADLDLSLDPTFAPIAGTFTGSFDGDERVLKNFVHVQSTQYTQSLGFFYEVGGNSDVSIRALNLIQSSITSNEAFTHIGGIVGKYSGSLKSLSHNHFSGLIKVSSNSSAGGLVERSKGVPTENFTGNLVSGFIIGGDVGAAGIINTVEDNASILLDKNFSTASVHSGDNTGGIVGAFENEANATLIITNSISSGTLKAGTSGGKAGGILAQLVTDNSGNNVSVHHNSSSVNISGGSRAGGLIGQIIHSQGTISLHDMSYAGRISGVDNAGGAFEQLLFGQNLTVSNITTSGSITVSGNVGGITSQTGDWFNSNAHITYDNVHSSMKVDGTAGAYTTGGLFGMMVVERQTNNRITLQNSSFTGTLKGLGRSAGITGQVTTQSGGHTITIQNVTVNASIEGTGPTSSGIARIEAFSNDSAQITLDNLNITATVTSPGWTLSGLVSSIYFNGSRNVNLTVKNSVVDATVSGQGNSAGAFSEIDINSANNGNIIDINNIKVSGSVSGSRYAGGFVAAVSCGGTGANTIAISKSSTSASVNAQDDVGGFLGYMSSSNSACSLGISNSYSSGAITSTGSTGVFAGYLSGQNGVDLYVENSYSTSIVTSTSGNLGGIAHNQSGVNIISSYWLKDPGIHNDAIPDDASTMKTTAQLQSMATFTGWDFSGTWNAPAAAFPTLKP